jgi:hypothetical protein
MTASIKRKDSKRFDMPVNFRNTMKFLDGNKIAGALASREGSEQ